MMIRRLWARSPAERKAFWQALPLVVGVRVRLWVRSLPRVLAWARMAATRRDNPGVQLPAPALVWAVQAIGRRLFRKSPCLPQALALWILLRRHGHAGQLRVGVAREGADGFEAHAWVEHGGQVLIGGEESPDRYMPLPTFDVG